MGRKKLDPSEKLARLNVRKENAKLTKQTSTINLITSTNSSNLSKSTNSINENTHIPLNEVNINNIVIRRDKQNLTFNFNDLTFNDDIVLPKKELHNSLDQKILLSSVNTSEVRALTETDIDQVINVPDHIGVITSSVSSGVSSGVSFPVGVITSGISLDINQNLPLKQKRGRKAKSKSSDNIDDLLVNKTVKTNEPKKDIDDNSLNLSLNDQEYNFYKSELKNDSYDTNISVHKCILKEEDKIKKQLKNNIPWIEKYRPKNVNDIILDDCLKFKIDNLIDMNILPNIIITGSAGTGKTSTIFCLAKQMLGSNYKEALLELNASDNRGLEIINNSIIHFCKKKINGVLDGSEDINKMKKIIIFDEADNLTKKAQNVLANLMEEYGNTTRFCFTCNDSSKIIESIQSRCLILYYRPMCKENIKKRLEIICNIEKVNYEISGLEAIIFISQGDIRQAINNLEATYNSYNIITEQNVHKLCYQPHPNTIIALIQKCVNKNLNVAIQKYDELKEQGYCNSDILQTMINVLKLIDIDERIRINFIEIISEIFLNVSDGIDTSLQMYSCICKMIKFIASN